MKYFLLHTRYSPFFTLPKYADSKIRRGDTRCSLFILWADEHVKLLPELNPVDRTRI